MPRAQAEPLDYLGFEPVVTRQTVQDSVYQGLSHALMAGRFDPGQTLTISALSELFGTSHMPVREALRRLAAEKALEISSSGSAYVPEVTLARLDDLCNARIIVEGAATEIAASLMDANLLRRLEQRVAEHVAAGQDGVSEMLAKNQQFHFELYRASNSPVLIQLIEALWLRFGPFLRMLTKHMEPQFKTREIDAYARHHFAIIDALKAKDKVRARRSLEADIRATQSLLRTLCAPD